MLLKALNKDSPITQSKTLPDINPTIMPNSLERGIYPRLRASERRFSVRACPSESAIGSP